MALASTETSFFSSTSYETVNSRSSNTALASMSANLSDDANSSLANASSQGSEASMSVDMYANTYLVDHPVLLVLFVALLSCAALFGVFGNGMVIYAVMTDRFLRQPANLLVINVAIADMFIAGVLNPFNIAGAVYGYDVFAKRRWLCLLIGSMCIPVCTSSLYNLALIAVSRYVHICKFNWYAKIYTWKNSFWMCLSVWGFGVLLTLPNHIGWGRAEYGALFFICTTDLGVYSYSILWLIAGIFAPFAMVAASYFRIFFTLRQRNRRLKNPNGALWQSETPDQTPKTSQTQVNDLILVQRRPPEQNFVVRDAIISDNNLDTISAVPYHKNSYPTSMYNKGARYGTHHGSVKKVSTEADKKKKAKFRAILSHYSRTRTTFKTAHEEVQLIRTLFLTVVAFMLGWSLFIILVLLRTPAWIPGWVYLLSIFLAHIQSAVNPIIYCVTNVHFRNAYKPKIFPLKS